MNESPKKVSPYYRPDDRAATVNGAEEQTSKRVQPRLTRNVEPNDARIKIEDSPRKVLDFAIIPAFSMFEKLAIYMLTRITADSISIIREDNNTTAIDIASTQSM